MSASLAFSPVSLSVFAFLPLLAIWSGGSTLPLQFHSASGSMFCSKHDVGFEERAGKILCTYLRFQMFLLNIQTRSVGAEESPSMADSGSTRLWAKTSEKFIKTCWIKNKCGGNWLLNWQSHQCRSWGGFIWPVGKLKCLTGYRLVTQSQVFKTSRFFFFNTLNFIIVVRQQPPRRSIKL